MIGMLLSKTLCKVTTRYQPAVTSVYSNGLWGRGCIRQQSAYYDSVENIGEIYLGHVIVKEHSKIDNCYYIDVGSSFTKKFCIIKI